MSNRVRLLSNVVALDAWYEPFVADRLSSKVFVDISFSEGRMGGDYSEFPYTFRLGLKRAKLSIMLSEPLVIDRDSVARSIPETQVEQTMLRTAKSAAMGAVGAKGELSLTHLTGALSGGMSVSKSVKREDELKVVQTVPPILVTSEPVSRQEYRWSLEPTYMSMLFGQPWSPVESPRLAARYDLSRLVPNDVVIKAEVTCAVEDLRISDVLPKEPSLQEKLIGRMERDTRNVAAEQHVRQILRHSNLEPGRMDNRFASLMVASVIATLEGD